MAGLRAGVDRGGSPASSFDFYSSTKTHLAKLGTNEPVTKEQ